MSYGSYTTRAPLPDGGYTELRLLALLTAGDAEPQPSKERGSLRGVVPSMLGSEA
jgi:hypothetical protein